MYARPSSSSSNSLVHSALHPPETFPPPTSTSTFRASHKQESSDSTELILIDNDSCSASRVLRSDVISRQSLFASLELGDYFLRQPRPIFSADDLDEVELKRCFEILHACHIASDTDATLLSTRHTMEDFLEAVFFNWDAAGETETVKPKMEFVVREYVNVGNVCNQPSHHQTLSACTDSLACQTPVYGIATYKSHPAQLSIGFSTQEPPRRSSEALEGLFCPMQRTDVRFQEEGDWMAELRRSMKRSCTSRVHRYNKRLAIWYARVLIRGWAMGSIWMGKDVVVLSFVLKGAVDAAFAMMGDF